MNTRFIGFLFWTTIASLMALLLLLLPVPVSSAPTIGGLSLYVTSAADEFDTSGSGTGCALREAIKLANNYFPPTFISFGGCSVTGTSGRITIYVPSGTYTLTLTGAGEDADVTGDLDITNTMTISATGAITVAGKTGWDDRIFDIVSGTVNIKGIEIKNGSITIDYGGGIHNAGIATLTDVALSGNSALYGGGIYNQGMLTLANATLSGNAATYDSTSNGGGIYNEGTLTVTNATLSGNSADYGGGMSNSGAGMATLTNVTFSGNSANYGGGIYSHGMLLLTNTTLSNNSGFVSGGGIFWVPGNGGVSNTIVANSLGAGNCNALWTTALNVTSNLSSDNTCGFGTGRNNVNVMLAPLGTYGGSTRTHMLMPGSPAIDSGTNTGCSSTDQRAKPRPVNGTCDVGAVERQLVDFVFLYLPLVKK